MSGAERIRGKVVCLNVRDAGIRVKLRIERGGYTPCPDRTEPDVTVSAGAREFLLLALRKEDPDTLFFNRQANRVDIEAFSYLYPLADAALIRPALAGHIPAANGRLLAAQTCLYTVTPDHDFIIDRAPGRPRMIVASPCSGHGFKFAPVMGEILADLASKGATSHDISRFRLARFG